MENKNKFDFTDGQWLLYGTGVFRDAPKHGYGVICNCNQENILIGQQFANARLISCAPEMINALIEMIKDGINNYNCYQYVKNMRSAEDYYSDEIKLIESATGKKWSEIK